MWASLLQKVHAKGSSDGQLERSFLKHALDIPFMAGT
jgi:hypothetical protein